MAKKAKKGKSGTGERHASKKVVGKLSKSVDRLAAKVAALEQALSDHRAALAKDIAGQKASRTKAATPARSAAKTAKPRKAPAANAKAPAKPRARTRKPTAKPSAEPTSAAGWPKDTSA